MIQERETEEVSLKKGSALDKVRQELGDAETETLESKIVSLRKESDEQEEELDFDFEEELEEEQFEVNLMKEEKGVFTGREDSKYETQEPLTAIQLDETKEPKQNIATKATSRVLGEVRGNVGMFKFHKLTDLIVIALAVYMTIGMIALLTPLQIRGATILYIFMVMFVIFKVYTKHGKEETKMSREEQQKWKDELAVYYPEDSRYQRIVKGLKLSFNSEKYYTYGFRNVSIKSSWQSEFPDDEILPVLVHEVGHIYYRDSLMRISKASAMEIIYVFQDINNFVYNTLLSRIPYVNRVMYYVVQLGNVIVAVFDFILYKFGMVLSNSAEYAADEFAIRAGLGEEFIAGFERGGYKEVSGVEKITYRFMSTHPPAKLRVERAKKVMAKMEQRGETPMFDTSKEKVEDMY